MYCTQTALAYAVCKNEVECTNFLVRAGAEVDKGVFKTGMTALMLAAKHGTLPCTVACERD